MDTNLNARWKAVEPPFHFECLHPEDLVPIADLLGALRMIVDALRATLAVPQLLSFDDWHEHDGYVTTSQEINWGTLEATLQDDAHLYAARPGDTHVYRAIYSDDHSFLLRFIVLDEDEDDHYPGIWGSFDFSAALPLLEQLQPKLTSILKCPLIRERAKKYFDSNYAG